MTATMSTFDHAYNRFWCSLLAALLLLGCASRTPPDEARRATFGDSRPPTDSETPVTRSPIEYRGPGTYEVDLDNMGTLEFATPEQRTSIFGVLTTGPDGKRRIDPASHIDNIDYLEYGWAIWVGDSNRPVRWTESITGPSTASWGGVDWVSPDGRTAVVSNEAIPKNGFIYQTWSLFEDSPGRYSVSVSLPGDRRENFEFMLSPALGTCPYSKVWFILVWSEYSEGGDPDKTDLTEPLISEFLERLRQHGFRIADGVDDAYWILQGSAMRGASDRSVVVLHVQMRAFVEFEGKALRYDAITRGVGGLVDFSYLWVTSASDFVTDVRELADKFAGQLGYHTRVKCADWASGSLEEEARLEKLRKELTAEIGRIRQERIEQEQRKRLQLEIEEPLE